LPVVVSGFVSSLLQSFDIALSFCLQGYFFQCKENKSKTECLGVYGVKWILYLRPQLTLP